MRNKIKADALGKIKKMALSILKEHDVARAGIFGSFARGEAEKGF